MHDKYHFSNEYCYIYIPKLFIVSRENVQSFRKLPMFVKEAMRMYSPVPFISRTLEEPLVLDDVTIPKGLVCDINIDSLHHNPSVYPDHEVIYGCCRSVYFASLISLRISIENQLPNIRHTTAGSTYIIK